MDVVDYCKEEVRRQGHNLRTVDGIKRTGWMLNAWEYALNQLQLGRTLPAVDDVIQLGRRVEKFKNEGGIRRCEVFIGNKGCPAPHRLNGLLVSLFESLRDGKYEGDALGFYRAFLEIHPFEDGNGRCAKILLAWVSGTLLDPYFPPANFWGKPILNP